MTNKLNEPENPFKLPDEIWLFILSHLDSLSDLASLKLTNKFFARIVEDPTLWQAAICQYFPQLENQKKEQFRQAPLALFNEEYQRYKKKTQIWGSLFYGMKMSHVLLALKSDVSAIDALADLAPEYKKRLFVISCVNGSKAALAKLNKREKYLALNMAAEEGNIGAVSQHINDIKNELTIFQKGIVIATAFKRLDAPIITFLMEHIGVDAFLAYLALAATQVALAILSLPGTFILGKIINASLGLSGFHVLAGFALGGLSSLALTTLIGSALLIAIRFRAQHYDQNISSFLEIYSSFLLFIAKLSTNRAWQRGPKQIMDSFEWMARKVNTFFSKKKVIKDDNDAIVQNASFDLAEPELSLIQKPLLLSQTPQVETLTDKETTAMTEDVPEYKMNIHRL